MNVPNARRVACGEVQRWRIRAGLNPLAGEVLRGMTLWQLVAEANRAKRIAQAPALQWVRSGESIVQGRGLRLNPDVATEAFDRAARELLAVKDRLHKQFEEQVGRELARQLEEESFPITEVKRGH